MSSMTEEIIARMAPEQRARHDAMQDMILDRDRQTQAPAPTPHEFTRAELMKMATSPPWLGGYPYVSFEIEQIVSWHTFETANGAPDSFVQSQESSPYSTIEEARKQPHYKADEWTVSGIDDEGWPNAISSHGTEIEARNMLAALKQTVERDAIIGRSIDAAKLEEVASGFLPSEGIPQPRIVIDGEEILQRDMIKNTDNRPAERFLSIVDRMKAAMTPAQRAEFEATQARRRRDDHRQHEQTHKP